MGLGYIGRSLVLVILFAKGGMALGQSARACESDPELFFKKNPDVSVVYACIQGPEVKLCKNSEEDCERVRVQSGLDKLRTLKKDSPRKQVLATYLSAVEFGEKVLRDSVFSIQTGKYQQVSVSPQALNSKCMTTIVQAAYNLHRSFHNYSFVIDSHIQSCHNLKEGVRQMIANRDRVRENLDQFNSPLHSVYLTNRTRFVHRELGQMGLHINVNRGGEIRRRLIDFEVGVIPTDGPRTRLTRMVE